MTNMTDDMTATADRRKIILNNVKETSVNGLNKFLNTFEKCYKKAKTCYEKLAMFQEEVNEL